MTDYFNHIYDETYHDVLRYVISKCRDLSYVEDIIQNIYTTLYKIINKKGNDYINNDKAFVIKLARRELYKHYLLNGKVKPFRDYNADDKIDEYIDIKLLAVDDQVFKSIATERIWEAISKEEIINQKIMVLYYLEDITIKEISDILSLNESTVKSKLYRTLSRLKEKFGEES